MMDDPWIVMRFWELGILCGLFFARGTLCTFTTEDYYLDSVA